MTEKADSGSAKRRGGRSPGRGRSGRREQEAGPAEVGVPSRDEYRALVENINDVVFSLDERGCITYVNPVVESVSGYRPGEIIGRNFAEFVYYEDLDALMADFVQTMSGAQKPFECRLMTKAGEVRWVRSSSRPIIVDGVAVGVRGVIRDITERRQGELALRESEQRLREFVDNASDVIYAHDLDGRLLSINAAGERVTGYTRAEALGLDVLSLVAPEDRERVREMVARKVAGENPGPYELEVVSKDGRRVPVEVNSRPILRGGRVIALEGIARDLTERRNAEACSIDRRRLAEEHEIAMALARVGREVISSRQEAVLLERLCRLTTEVLRCDCSHTLLWDRNADLFRTAAGWGDTPEQAEVIRVVNIPRAAFAGVLDRLGRDDVADTLGLVDEGVLPAVLPARLGVTAGVLAALRRGEDIVGIHTACFRGRREPFDPQAKAILRGMAHLASLGLANVQLLEELERANRLKSDFVATMSHELRTPLNVIIGYTQMLADEAFGRLSDAQRDMADRIDKNSRELLDLVDATLAVGRIETGRLTVAVKEVPVDELLREIDAETRDRWQKPNVTLAWDAVPDLPPLQTDPLKLKVVIKNLVSNAIKFTPAGSVTIRVRPCGGGLEFAVIDTGIGIAPEARSLIFERFRQAHNSIMEQYGGVGLGLYIVQRLTEILGGWVSVESELGRGSTFRAWVPVAPPTDYGL